MKKIFLRLFAFICLAGLFFNAGNAVVFGREIIDESNTEGCDEQETPVSTVNIRCYVDKELKECDETIFFTIYNKTQNVTTDFQLNAVNGYFDNVNVQPGECYLYASISNNDGSYKLYTPYQSFNLTSDPVEILCAYGTDRFLETAVRNWQKLGVYEVVDLDTMVQDPVKKEETSTEVIETDREQKRDAIESLPKKEQVSNEEKESRKINLAAVLLFVMVVVYCVVGIRKRIKNREQ